MVNEIARSQFAKQFSQLDRKRKLAMSRPLTMKEITSLLSIKKHGEPIYASIEAFYSEDYKNALNAGNKQDAEKVQKYRSATETEANILYCDVHERELMND